MKEYFDQQIRDRVKELDSFEDALSIGKLTLASYSSSARAQMFTQHLVQSWVPKNPELPRVTTGYEHMFGEFSGSEKRTDKKLEVVKKISKYDDMIYTLIVYDKKKRKYDIIQRNEVKKQAEGHGYEINNEVIDSYDEGDTIAKGTTLYRSPSTDEYGNYMYGVNGKVVYVISPETIEDAIVISESFAKKLTVTKVETCIIPINDNDIPLNLYGDKKNYKSFPDIGETMKKSILCGTRRRDKLYDQYNLKNANLRKIFSSDSIYQFMGNWRIVDIDLWSNKPLDDIPDLPAYQQVKKYYSKISAYWETIYNELHKIINNDDGDEYSQELSQLYSKARDYLNPGTRYVHEDRMFSNIIMEFTIAKDEPLRKGCKLAGRFGNKSVISTILPDEEMGVTDEGIVPDIRIDALGVLGRLNSGQCIEQELNWIADKVLYDIRSMGDTGDSSILNEQFRYLLDFIKEINKDQHFEMVEFLDSLSGDERKEFMDNIISGKEPIYIQQSPVYCVTGDDLYRLYDKYDMKKTSIKYKKVNGSTYKALRDVIVADEYFIRLKQEPITKYSARSASLINPTSFLPIKSLNNRKHKTLFQDQANKIGEQELHILMLSNDPDALDYFYRLYASSVTGRRDTTLYTEDPKNGFEINMKSEKSKVIDKLNALIGSVGYSLEIEYDNKYDSDQDDIDEENSYDPGIESIPKYIKEKF